jgi:hypothetical protein
MGGKNKNIKGRRIKGGFLALPHCVLEHEDYLALSARAIRLLIDLGLQFKGYNNGDLCAAMKLMRQRGWRSSDQLNKAKVELVERSLIILTRQGGRNQASLYALSWHPIDHCKGKLDIPSTEKAPRSFK